MDIIIQSPGFTASEALQQLIREKLATLKAGNIVRANVTMYKGPEGNPQNEYCEIRLEVPGNDHFVKKNSAYFETSLSSCVEILQQMIKENKDKKLAQRQADEKVIQDALLNADNPDEAEKFSH
jgi:putative sigma-54 modulation protein